MPGLGKSGMLRMAFWIAVTDPFALLIAAWIIFAAPRVFQSFSHNVTVPWCAPIAGLSFHAALKTMRPMTTNSISKPFICVLVLAGTASFVLAAEQGQLGYSDTPLIPGTQWHVHDGNRPQPRVVAPGATFSQLAAPPSDAIVLFDGTDFSKWKSGNGG